MKYCLRDIRAKAVRRTPQGVRGLKWDLPRRDHIDAQSHPARGAWIEMVLSTVAVTVVSRRTPQGVRGLKSLVCISQPPVSCRTPQGVRGLKYRLRDIRAEAVHRRTPQGVRGLKYSSSSFLLSGCGSRTPQGVRGLKLSRCALNEQGEGRTPQGVRGLKSVAVSLQMMSHMSHPTRGAWIEIR